MKLSSHGRKVEKLDRSIPEIEGLVAATGLSPLIAFSLDTGNQRLKSAFVERWHKETSSFHLPIGEVIITLNDVTSLLRLPITGAFHSYEALHVDKVIFLSIELLEVSSEEARVEIVQCHEAYVRLSWMWDIYRSKCDACNTVDCSSLSISLAFSRLHTLC